MGKPKGYRIPNPEISPPESKKEKQRREKQRMKLVRAALAKSPDNLRQYGENHLRSVRFDSLKHKGTRSEHERDALRDATED